MLVFFKNLSFMVFQVRYLALFLLFSVIGSFGSFWMRNVHKNIQLILQLLKGPFLVLHFSYYTLMTFLIMLSVILLSMRMRMIILPTLNVIRHLICADLWQQLELASELEPDLRDTVDWGRKWHVDFNAGKTELVSFNLSKNAGAIDVKMDGLFLRKNHLLRC